MKGKRVIALILSMLILTLAGSGCGSKKVDVTKPSTDSKPSAEKLTEIKLPIVKEPLTLTMWWPMDAKMATTMKSYEEMRCFKELEKKTGIHIKFLHPPIGQEKDQFNLMIASNDLPDIIFSGWRGITGGPGKYIEDKVIIKLNNQIDTMAPNLTKIFSKDSSLKKDSILDDGTLYMFPHFREDKKMNIWLGPQIRRDWLKKLNIPMPTTIDDWHNVLTAFKDKDPNGNGKNDEIPFTGNLGNVYNLAASWGLTSGFYMDNGKVKYGPVEPKYKDFMTTMNQWYKEKLIDQDILSNDDKAIDYKITNNNAGSFYGLLRGGMGKYIPLMKAKDPNFDLVGAPLPIGPGGKPYTDQNWNQLVMGNGAAITTKNSHVKETVLWLDNLYTQDSYMLLNFGIEGESYTMVNGKPIYTDEIMHNKNGLSQIESLARFSPSVSQAPFVQALGYVEQMSALPQQLETLDTWGKADLSLVVSPISLTPDEGKKVASIMNEVNTFKDEKLSKFLLGVEPISAWDDYVKTIKGMGIDEVVKIQNAALERYKNRK